MQPLTEYLLRLTFLQAQSSPPTATLSSQSESQVPSQQILDAIYSLLNSRQNYRDARPHKASLSSEDSYPTSPPKCNCKKSKCLKLYCECFARGTPRLKLGSFCINCNCACCMNTPDHPDVRARAIDQMLIRTLPAPFGLKTASSGKGCNCRKTECRKKYCECLGSGVECGEWCKCSNCANC